MICAVVVAVVAAAVGWYSSWDCCLLRMDAAVDELGDEAITRGFFPKIGSPKRFRG